MEIPTIADLYATGAHYGHKNVLTHPKFKKYIFDNKEGINIVNLELTIAELARATDFIKKLLAENKKILFVGTKKQARTSVSKYATESDMPYINYRWLGGTLTNFSTIAKRVNNYLSLKEKLESKSPEIGSKKEESRLRKELEKSDKFFFGIKDMKSLPDAMYVIDPALEHVAVAEAKKINIPVIALSNTNADISKIDYVIAANDNAPKTIDLITSYIASVIKEFKAKTKKK